MRGTGHRQQAVRKEAHPPRGKEKESQRTNQVLRFVTAGPQVVEAVPTCHQVENAVEASNVSTNAAFVFHHPTRMPIANLADSKDEKAKRRSWHHDFGKLY